MLIGIFVLLAICVMFSYFGYPEGNNRSSDSWYLGDDHGKDEPLTEWLEDLGFGEMSRLEIQQLKCDAANLNWALEHPKEDEN